MSDDDLLEDDGTVEDEALSTDDIVDGLADLLDDDPETDLAEDDEAAADDSDDDDASEDDDSEDVDEDDENEEEDGQPEYSGGKFAAHNAKVTLDDGSVITVGELARNNLYQRDYTKKTTEHAENVKTFEEKSSQVSQLEDQLNQQREYILWYAQNYMPQQPERFAGDAALDPVGYTEHRQKLDEWTDHQQTVAYFQQQQAEQQQANARNTTATTQEDLVKEANMLKAKDASFSDPEKASVYFTKTPAIANKLYGFTPEDFNGITDHRMHLVLKDAIAYRQLKSKAPKAKEKVKDKPSMAQRGRRVGPKSKNARAAKARSDALRKSGSFEDGVAALMDLDL